MIQLRRHTHVLCVLFLLSYPLFGFSSPLPADTFASKQTIVQPGYVYDDFKKVDIQVPGGHGNQPYWWVINNGDGLQTYAECGDATCVTGEKEQSLKYARLRLLHDTTPAVWNGLEYNGTEISEYRTMYSGGLPGLWLPTAGHPVSVSARVRFSPNYAQDGSGGAIGSAGIWLWNSYPDPQGYLPVDALGFNWFETGAAGNSAGLQVNATQATSPVYSQLVAGSVDMSAWHVWMFTWSADPAGSQSIQWWLDGASVGQTDLAAPFEALSLTMWNDNQFPTFLQNGQFTVVMHNPAAEQYFDVDWVEIDQPQ